MAGDLSMDTEEERWLLMKAHADAALLLEPKNKYAQYLQIKYFEGTDQVERAVALMKKLLFEYPEFNGELMQHRLSIGEVRDAKLYARGVIRYAESNVGHEGRLLAVDYAYWSAAARLLGRMDEAALRAREGGKKFPDHPDIKKLAAVSVLTQLNRTEPTSPEFLPLLCEAHVLNKDNQLLVNRLAARLTYEPFEVEGLLEEMKANKTVAPNVFITTGELHLRGGRVQEAMKYFEEAVDYEPASGRAYNNMAWVMANIKPTRLRAALEASNRAIEIEARADFFETRGQIHFQMEAWDSAANDLEAALRGILPEGDRLKAHSTLSNIYEELGKPELASAHRQSSQRPAATSSF